MTGFIVACIGMVLIAVALFAWPLFRKANLLSTGQRWRSVIAIALIVSLVSGGIYTSLIRKRSGWLPDNAEEVTVWLRKGADSLQKGRPAEAVTAYQHAYDLSQGVDIDAITGLADALLLTRNAAVMDRVSTLVDTALARQPNNPDAVWLGGLVALNQNKLSLARDRFRSMLAMNLPPQAKTALEREIQDLDQQLGEPSSIKPVVSENERSIAVNVKLDPKLSGKIKSPMTLFILARDPSQSGPPLAVQRHMSTELPLDTTLTKANAMMPERSIDSADTVEVVARLSASGNAIQQPGDYAGSALYSFSKQGQKGAVTIEINQAISSATQQLKSDSLPATNAAAEKQSDRRITVNVKLASGLKDRIKSPLTLYILARVPDQGGPPLAVQRHTSSELPLKIELTKDNAMMPNLSIDTTDQVEVVARLSASGTPMQQSGDYVGSVRYSFSKQGSQGTVNIEIDHQVP